MWNELGRTGSSTSSRRPGWIVAALTLLVPFVVVPFVVPAAAISEERAAAVADAAAVVEAIRSAATAYREAVSKGDANAIRGAWTADGDIVDGWGNRFEAQASGVLTGSPAAGPRPEFHVGETRLRLISADVALESPT